MSRLSGAGSAARLVHALMLQLHGTRPGDLEDAGFPPPDGREPVELCTAGGKRAAGRCGETLREGLRPSEIPEEEPAGASVHIAAAAPPQAPAIRIVSPERDTHIWRNPDAPPGLARIALKAKVDPGVRQVVWMVDGEPFATSDPDQPVLWPLQKGVHHFQLKLPLQPGGSKMVSVEVD